MGGHGGSSTAPNFYLADTYTVKLNLAKFHMG
jgi:hypothetical protein